MKCYGFEIACEYEILKGYVWAISEEHARVRILNEEWTDILDSFDTEIFTEGYEILDIWEID